MFVSLEIDKIAENRFNELGIEPLEAIREFINYIKERHELPFKIPNAETLEAIYESEQGVNMEEIDFVTLISQAKDKTI